MLLKLLENLFPVNGVETPGNHVTNYTIYCMGLQSIKPSYHIVLHVEEQEQQQEIVALEIFYL